MERLEILEFIQEAKKKEKKLRNPVAVAAELRRGASRTKEMELISRIKKGRAGVNVSGTDPAYALARHIRSNPAAYKALARKYWNKPPIDMQAVAGTLIEDPGMRLIFNKVLRSAAKSSKGSALRRMYAEADRLALVDAFHRALSKSGHKIKRHDALKLFNILVLASPLALKHTPMAGKSK